MLTINIGGKERPMSLRFLAVREFQKRTNRNIAGGKITFFEVLGGQDHELDPDLFINLLYCVLLDGMYPEKPDFTVEDVATWVPIHKIGEVGDKLYEVWLTNLTGKTKEEIIEEFQKKSQKQDDSTTNGTTSSPSLMAS